MMSRGSSSEKLSSSFKNLTSSHSQGKETPRAYMHDDNADTVSEGDGDACLVADSASSDEAGVSDDANKLKTEDLSSKNVVSYIEEHPKIADVSNADYDSMLSMFDEYAANGKALKVGHGYEVGDMVWGKVKSHPWWPGHIFSEAFATTSVRKAKREGHVLVAFFGDSSYGWFDPAELIPFELNFAEKSRQTGSRTFVKAVEDAVDELNKRHSLGLTCRCRNHYSFRPTNVEGCLAVDFGDSEGVFSVSQIRRARENFVPAGMLGFLKELALKPMNNEPWDIDFILSNATMLAFRKAVYEEFDETYSQAFGTQPARPAPAKASLEPSRAPLSGRLVFAEALGKRTTSRKPSKSKDEPEKDKYSFKRIDEPASMSSHPSQIDGSDPPAKEPNPDVLCAASHSTLPNAAEVAQASEDQPVADQFHANELVNDNLGEKHNSGAAEKKLSVEKTDRELKKAKVRKRPFGHMDSESCVAMEKTKKRKKDLAMETKSSPTSIPGPDDNGATVAGKIRENFPSAQVYPGREDCQVNQQGDEVARYPMFPGLLLEGEPNKDSQVNLPQLLHDLRALALNPFHGAESNCSAYVSQVFMNFRSLVYLKSPSNESREARLSMLASLPSSSDNNDNNNNNNSTEKPKATRPSLRTPKPVASLEEDSAKGGLKRGPSDHLELVAAKKKRIKDVKLLAAKKRVSEANKLDGKDSNTIEASKVIGAQTVEKKFSQKKTSDTPRIDGKEVAAARKPPARVLVVGLSGSGSGPGSGSEPAKKKELPAKAEAAAAAAASPTILIMRFPAEASLPSSAELRAKFARFGSMDYKATRIFYTSHTCRVVYNRKSDAQAALNFATSSNFGYMNVRCYLREKDSENPEAESTKVQVDDSHHIGGTPQSRDQQLKSCLRRTPYEDGGVSIPGGGNGNGGKGRVKFMLGDGGGSGNGDGSNRTNADDNIASSHGLNYNTTDNFHVVVPTPSSSSTTTTTIPVHSSQFQFPIPIPFPFPPNNFPQTIDDIIQPRNHLAVARAPPNSDIRQTMLSLLCRCEGILKTLEGSFGYVPYHL